MHMKKTIIHNFVWFYSITQTEEKKKAKLSHTYIHTHTIYRHIHSDTLWAVHTFGTYTHTHTEHVHSHKSTHTESERLKLKLSSRKKNLLNQLIDRTALTQTSLTVNYHWQRTDKQHTYLQLIGHMRYLYSLSFESFKMFAICFFLVCLFDMT